MTDPKEMFETLKREYDEVYKKFSEFVGSPIGQRHRKALGSFLHETNSAAGNVGYHLNKGTFPKRGEPSVLWIDYNKVHTNIGIMELILELGEQDGKE